MNIILTDLFALVHSLGGTISGEHGIGLIQKGFMPVVMSEAAINIMRSIKLAFDPNLILNPGKIFDI
jgi:glycolate oxidase